MPCLSNDDDDDDDGCIFSVALPVWIDVPPQNTVALVNETVDLECKGRGVPPPTITWKKNDQLIHFPSSPRYSKTSTDSLKIKNSQKSDSGKYTCVATNSVGSKWANATLTVWSKCKYYTVATLHRHDVHLMV